MTLHALQLIPYNNSSKIEIELNNTNFEGTRKHLNRSTHKRTTPLLGCICNTQTHNSYNLFVVSLLIGPPTLLPYLPI